MAGGDARRGVRLLGQDRRLRTLGPRFSDRQQGRQDGNQDGNILVRPLEMAVAAGHEILPVLLIWIVSAAVLSLPP